MRSAASERAGGDQIHRGRVVRTTSRQEARRAEPSGWVKTMMLQAEVLGVMFSPSYSELIGRARTACEECASRCGEALAQSVLPGTAPYTEHQIALLTCASVCQLTATGLNGQGRHIREMVSWCRDVCKAWFVSQEVV